MLKTTDQSDGPGHPAALVPNAGQVTQRVLRLLTNVLGAVGLLLALVAIFVPVNPFAGTPDRVVCGLPYGHFDGSATVALLAAERVVEQAAIPGRLLPDPPVCWMSSTPS
jgi:hypothetical protein